MTKTESAVQWAIRIANDNRHGYSQANRWGNPDYDCSSLVISAWQQAGVPVKSNGATYTGNMYNVFRACGFTDVTASCNRATGAGMQRGDVLLNVKYHTAMYIGGGQMVQASSTRGHPEAGDQTGTEIWVCRYYNYSRGCSSSSTSSLYRFWISAFFSSTRFASNSFTCPSISAIGLSITPISSFTFPSNTS